MTKVSIKQSVDHCGKAGLTVAFVFIAFAGALPPDRAAASDQIATAIAQKYRALGGAESRLGLAVGPVRTNPGDTGKRRKYEHGHIYWSPATGTHVIYDGSIWDQWAEQKWEQGPLGYPASDPSPTKSGRIHVQEFTGGALRGTVTAAERTSTDGPQGSVRAAISEGVRLQPTHSIVIDGVAGSGSSSYTLSASGQIEAADGTLDGYEVTQNEDDVVDGATVRGRVAGGRDGFLVYGELREVSLDDPRAAVIRVDGEPRNVESGMLASGSVREAVGSEAFHDPSERPTGVVTPSNSPGDSPVSVRSASDLAGDAVSLIQIAATPGAIADATLPSDLAGALSTPQQLGSVEPADMDFHASTIPPAQLSWDEKEQLLELSGIAFESRSEPPSEFSLSPREPYRRGVGHLRFHDPLDVDSKADRVLMPSRARGAISVFVRAPDAGRYLLEFRVAARQKATYAMWAGEQNKRSHTPETGPRNVAFFMEATEPGLVRGLFYAADAAFTFHDVTITRVD